MGNAARLSNIYLDQVVLGMLGRRECLQPSSGRMQGISVLCDVILIAGSAMAGTASHIGVKTLALPCPPSSSFNLDSVHGYSK